MLVGGILAKEQINSCSTQIKKYQLTVPKKVSSWKSGSHYHERIEEKQASHLVPFILLIVTGKKITNRSLQI